MRRYQREQGAGATQVSFTVHPHRFPTFGSWFSYESWGDRADDKRTTHVQLSNEQQSPPSYLSNFVVSVDSSFVNTGIDGMIGELSIHLDAACLFIVGWIRSLESTATAFRNYTYAYRKYFQVHILPVTQSKLAHSCVSNVHSVLVAPVIRWGP
jgi:hypothetical protein